MTRPFSPQHFPKGMPDHGWWLSYPRSMHFTIDNEADLEEA
jgi:hypothetical protein